MNESNGCSNERTSENGIKLKKERQYSINYAIDDTETRMRVAHNLLRAQNGKTREKCVPTAKTDTENN